MTATALPATSALDDYQVQPHRYDQFPGIVHLNVRRHDHAPIEHPEEPWALKERVVPGGDVHWLDLWVREPTAPSEPALPSPAAAAAAAAAPSASATPPAQRRRPRAPRRAATLNLTRREVSVLDELAERVTAATDQGRRLRELLDLDSEREQLLAAIRDKLERLPHDQVVVDETGADW